MEFKEILPDLLMATEGGINLYLLRNGRQATLVDCGTEEMGPHIVAALGRDISVADIVLTHAHYDHAGGASAVHEATGAPIWMHDADADLVAKGQWLRPARHAGTPLSWVLNRLVVEKGPERIPPVSVSVRLKGEMQLAVAGGMTAHHMPGHSAGQIALTWTNVSGTRVLFAADTCMNVIGLTQPIIYESKPDGQASIGRLADLAEQVDIAVFGHGRPLRDPARKLKRFAARFATN